MGIAFTAGSQSPSAARLRSMFVTGLPAQEAEIRTPNLRLMLDVTKFLASAQRTKGTREIPTGAESKAKIFSPAPMLLFGPNSAPNSS